MIGYIIFRLVVFIFWLIPFKVLYILSDGVAFLLHNVVKYRKSVVYKQLIKSFPEKSSEEINRIARLTYANLADILLESIKGFSMSEKSYMKRYKFLNVEVCNKYLGNGISTIHAAAHYTNWEWGATSYPLWFDYPVYGFYKPLTNKYIEAYGAKKRSMFGMRLVPIQTTSSKIEEVKDEANVYVFVGDQSTWSDNAHWVNFLGQDTACPRGIDKYARELSLPVFYVHMNRVKRGYYEIFLEEIIENGSHFVEGEITKRYMQKLEEIIKKKPANWLWSHKRWKKVRTKPSL